MKKGGCLAAVALALLPDPARAQLPASSAPATTEWFTGAAVAMTVSRSGDEFPGNPSALAPGIQGSALEGLLTAGAFITPHVGFAAEFMVPRSFRVQQTWGRDASTWDNEHRDLSLMGLVLIRTAAEWAQLTGTIGAGNVWSRTTTVRRFRRFPTDPPSFTNQTREEATDLALVGGAELSMSISNRVSLVPQFRLIFVPRENFFNEQLATVIYHAGVGVRVRFR